MDCKCTCHFDESGERLPPSKDIQMDCCTELSFAAQQYLEEILDDYRASIENMSFSTAEMFLENHLENPEWLDTEIWFAFADKHKIRRDITPSEFYEMRISCKGLPRKAAN
jgi:hypothetical protein